MPLNGDVKTFPLAAIVQMVHDERKTGILTVSTSRRPCNIYFREGKIIHVRGNTDKEMKLSLYYMVCVKKVAIINTAITIESGYF